MSTDSNSPLKQSALIAGDTYEYCYTFVYAGIESPPSPVTRVKLPSKDKDGALVEAWTLMIQSQSSEGEFTRNGTFGRPEPHTSWGLGPVDTLDPRTTDTILRITGRTKRFYRRKVNDHGDATLSKHTGVGEYEPYVASDASTPDMLIQSALTMFQGNQRFLHIGDHFTDGPIRDCGMKQDEFSAAGAAAEAFFAELDEGNHKVPTLGWPQSHFIERGQWTYHDGEMSKVKVLDESGPRQTIKVYRPPSEDMNVEIRYLSRPKRLVSDADTPEWPVQYHHLLVYMALADICLQHGMSTQAQLYENKSIELLDRMKQKYLSRTNRKYVRRGFDRTLFAGERFGVPTKV